ncbi:hypothetical protein ACWC9R_08745 [Streptomyces sp. NPDC001219]
MGAGRRRRLGAAWAGLLSTASAGLLGTRRVAPLSAGVRGR